MTDKLDNIKGSFVVYSQSRLHRELPLRGHKTEAIEIRLYDGQTDYGEFSIVWNDLRYDKQEVPKIEAFYDSWVGMTNANTIMKWIQENGTHPVEGKRPPTPDELIMWLKLAGFEDKTEYTIDSDEVIDEWLAEASALTKLSDKELRAIGKSERLQAIKKYLHANNIRIY